MTTNLKTLMLQIDEPFYVNLSLHLRWSIKLFGFPLKQELFESTAMLVSKKFITDRKMGLAYGLLDIRTFLELSFVGAW